MKTTWAPTSRAPVAGGFPSSHLSPGRPRATLQGLCPLPGPFFQACSCHRKQTRLKPLFQQNKRACERTTRWLLRGPTVYLSPRWPHLVFWKRESRASIQALPYCTLDTAPDPSLRPHPRLPEWFPESLQQTCERRGRDSFLHPHSPVGTNKATATSQDSSVPQLSWAGVRGRARGTPRGPKAFVLLEASGRRRVLAGQPSPGALSSDPRTAHRAPLEGQEQAGEKPPVVPAPPQLTGTQAASPCRSPVQSVRHGASWWAVGPAARCWTGLC